MKTYWDLTESQRAALAREDVEKYEAAELMTKGVLRIEAPELVPVPDLAAVQKVRVYAPSAGYWSHELRIGWLNEAEAIESVAGAVFFQRDSGIGESVQETPPKIESLEVITLDAIAKHRSLMQQAEESKTANAKATEAYRESQRLAKQAVGGMWEDWHACRAKDAEMQRVVRTFETYTKTADGDLRVAVKFLAKVFDGGTIREAAAWTGNDALRVAHADFVAQVEAPAEA